MSKNTKPRLVGQELKDAKSALSKLRKAGLYAGKKFGQPTAYALKQIKKFADVVSGLAKTVTASKATKEAYKDTLRGKGNKLIVPIKPQNSEMVRVVKSKVKGAPDEIRIYGDSVSGPRYTRSLTPKGPRVGPERGGGSKADRLRAQEGPGVLFLVPIQRGRRGVSYMKFDQYADAAHIIQEYVRRSAGKAMTEGDIMARIVSWTDEIEVERTRAA